MATADVVKLIINESPEKDKQTLQIPNRLEIMKLQIEPEKEAGTGRTSTQLPGGPR